MRDTFSDFICILIKELVLKYKHLKFILISSSTSCSSSNELLQKYFNLNAVTLSNYIIMPKNSYINYKSQNLIYLVPSFGKIVQEYFLEDILRNLPDYGQTNQSLGKFSSNSKFNIKYRSLFRCYLIITEHLRSTKLCCP